MYDQDKIKEYLAKLPIDIKNIIYSLDYPKLLQEIVRKNRLLIDQAGKLEIETTLVLSGLAQLKDYIDNLSRELGIPREKASEIARDVDEMIFKSIRESLRKINSEEENLSEVMGEGVKIPIVSAEPSREEVISGIENPTTLREKEDSVSISSLKSNNPPEVFATEILKDIEIRKDNFPEIPPEAMLPAKVPGKVAVENFHQNISPVENIVESKTTTPIITTREKVIITEKTKLPEITPTIKKIDPYREEIR